MKIIRITEEYEKGLREGKRVLSKGGVILYPTDTVYGIGGDGRRESVVERVMEIKGIKKKRPFSLVMGSFEMIWKYCKGNKEQRRIVEKYLPGPYTFILKARKKLPVSYNGKIAVRIPMNAFIRRLSDDLEMPIISTSANLTGKRSPNRIREVSMKIKKAVDLILDGGPTDYKGESTVVDLVSKRIIRKGSGKFSWKER